MKFSLSRCLIFPFSRFPVFMVVAILFITHASAQVVDIPDSNLERAIRGELGLSSEVQVTQQEMLRLKRLELLHKQIKDITGLQHAKNLTFLDLASNEIGDITPLGELVNLELLEIRNNPIGDITPLSNLTKLAYLNAGGIDLTDITPLSNLTQLRTLVIWHNQITDITPLANLTQLEDLNLSYNQITDISPLANLTVLIELQIAGNQIVDVSPLANLTRLQTLLIYDNRIIDFSPLQGLSLVDLRYDEVCVLPALPIQDRIDNRSLPSIVLAWDNGISSADVLLRNWWDDSMPYLDRVAYHDLWWHYIPFGTHFELTPQGYQLIGNLPRAIARRDELLSKNPNMLFLVDLRYAYASPDRYPEDWFGWLRDEDGNLIRVSDNDVYYIDFRLPEVQNIIAQRAIAVAKCGLYDGIFFDSWNEGGYILPNASHEEELPARISILSRIREGVPDDFLILCNQNQEKLPHSAPYINGGFMETFPRMPENGYTRADIIEIETNLIWYEANVREPQINCLRGFGVGAESPDSPSNKQWMRLFTTMSLTLSDGYSLYTLGTIGGQKQFQKHIRHPFWDADLGQPVGPKTQRYQEDIEGLYIREFTNGWAVYNRSGQAQAITLPSSATSVSDRGSTAASITHLLPDLDGEIYLKTKHPADVNGDWVVNILDLVHVANNFGKADPDLNGDGVVNILDLTFVAKHLSQNAAAPSQLTLIESISSTAKEVIAVQRALTELEAIPNKSHGVQIAIELLRHYLSIADPNVQETKLLSNYPNPCNPDTWIPYQLSEGATVTVKIYDVTGSLVRTIQVGHKPAGYYLTRERAIYWDGRNQNREPVSSGVYFYTLNTDAYTQTRRMLILK